MDSSAAGRAFAVTPVGRALLVGGLAFLLLEVLAGTQHYATAVALAGLAALIIWDGARRRVTSLSADAQPRRAQQDQVERLERASALLDAVTIVLIAIAPDGRIALANRAARQFAGGPAARLADIVALGEDAAVQILGLPVGARRILTLASGEAALVWTVGFAVSGRPHQKLVSLQLVAGELDAVQVRAWQDMTRVLAHEIMNSLTPIASLSESAAALIEGEAQPPAVAGAIHAIARRSLHLLDFVERYRQVAELPEPRLRRVAAAELLDDIETLLRPDLTARGIAFRCEIHPRELAFDADPELLSQAILNLLRNAQEAVAGIESSEIRLSCEQAAGEIACTITDNGPGVPPDKLQEIFVPSFTTKDGGSGIGLTLARQIALAHGGRIDVHNRAGGGASFRMTIAGTAL